ncbi:amidohydrolase family protein [Leucobacter luti]|uniref:amidohydrolase family protein n=1 Tax=Leucobacter luti TaxID=340320 RepID=UPI003D066048
MNQRGDVGAARSARAVRVLRADGGFSAPVDVAWSERGIRIAEPEAGRAPESPERWLIPGLVDAHAHLAWHDVDAADRARRNPADAARLTSAALAALLAAGFTSVRDAGGLSAAALAGAGPGASLAGPGASLAAAGATASPLPRVQLSVTLIDRAVADAAGGVARAAERALDAGARWVKLVATAGVASPAGTGLDPVFSAAELREAVAVAAERGAGVMVHAWGGRAIDDAIEAGALSIEHGIFLTPDQARRGAERGVTLVPTLRIYREVRDMIDEGELPEAFRPRVEEAIAAHPGAVRIARDAGMPIALGTDSGTPAQHASGWSELDALVAAGLEPGEALLAATVAGAALLAKVASGAPDPAPDLAPAQDPAPHHFPDFADAVLLRRDPREPGAARDPELIEAVVLDGVTHSAEALRAAARGLRASHPRKDEQ